MACQAECLAYSPATYKVGLWKIWSQFLNWLVGGVKGPLVNILKSQSSKSSVTTLHLYVQCCVKKYGSSKKWICPRFMPLELSIHIVGPAQYYSSLILHPRCQYPIWALVHVILLHIPIQLPAYGLGKQQRMDEVFKPLQPRGIPGESSWLQSSPALSIEAIWGVSQHVEDHLSVYPSLSL